MSIGNFAIGSRAIGAGPAEAGESTGPITLQLRLDIRSPAAITLPLRLSVGLSGAARTLGARLVVISDSYLGGFNGAGGWPSAPDGRWRPVVILGEADISASVQGELSVQHADNEARTAQFSFKPIAVLQPMEIVGRRVQIWFAQRGSVGEPVAAQLIFTGVVERPTINMQTGLISCDCHDQMQEVAVNTTREWIVAQVGGRWRAEVSGEARDNWDFLRESLEAVPKSFVLDEQQLPRIIHWSEGLRAETVREADIVDNTLAVDLPSRDEVRTRITCRLQYRFNRLRGRGAVASYYRPVSFFLNGGLNRQLQWLTPAMIKSSAEGLRGWEIRSLRIENPLPGAYQVGAVPEDGFYIIPTAIAPTLAVGFEARYSTTWVQTLTHDLTVELVLPDLEAQMGRVSEEIGTTMEVPFDVRDWGTDPSVDPVLDIPLAGDVILPWHPEGSDFTARDEVLRTLLDRAWVRLWAASRSGRVRFAVPLRPNLWLDNQVTVETARLRARGKVVEVEHRMSIEEGEAVTSVTVAVGFPGGTTASMPTWTLPTIPAPDDEREPDAYSFEIGTFVGGELTSPVFDEEAMIGFSTNRERPPLLAENFYPHQLSIRAPNIEALDRDPLQIPVTQSIETAIPLDLLEFT